MSGWSGAYCAVHTGALGRSDRTALRRRERALSLLGFRELAPALSVRPDNLVAGLDGVRERLRKLGLEPQAPVFLAQGFSPEEERRARLKRA